MTEIEIDSLKARQRQLLKDWLDTTDGAKRFAILTELRAVERELASDAVRARRSGRSIRTFAVR